MTFTIEVTLAAILITWIGCCACLYRHYGRKIVRLHSYSERIDARTARTFEDYCWRYRAHYANLAKTFHEDATGIPAWIAEAGIDLSTTYGEVA